MKILARYDDFYFGKEEKVTPRLCRGEKRTSREGKSSLMVFDLYANLKYSTGTGISGREDITWIQ